MKFIDFCDRNRILLAIYSPHSTHILQPLDVCLFRPLSQAYSNELMKFMDECQGFSSITKRDFFRLFWYAWEASFTSGDIFSGFESTGLHSFNPQRVISKFAKKDENRPSFSSSTNTVVGAEDWKRIEKLLKAVVSNIYEKKAQQLSNTMHALSTENMLLKMQNDGLKKRLVNEKKRRKRGKPLMLDFPTSNEGGAIFYSPNKMQQARDRQDQKAANAEAERRQKEVDKTCKKAEKAAKVRLVEERKTARTYAKEMKLYEQEERWRQKDEEIQAKEANQQLHNKLAIKARKVQKPVQPQKKCNSRGNKDMVVVEDEELPPPLNARGRQIRLPERFRPIKL
jgi:hypothetical protein